MNYIVCKMKTQGKHSITLHEVVISDFGYIEMQDQQSGQQIMISLWKSNFLSLGL